MSAYAILRQSHSSPESFDAAREALVQAHLLEVGDASIPVWEALSVGADYRDSFDRAAAFLTGALEGRSNLTVLVDEVDTAKLNPLLDKGWSSLVAMLILAFPEVRWVFLLVKGQPPQGGGDPDDRRSSGGGEREKKRREIELCLWRRVSERFDSRTLTEQRGTQLFDGYGLRQAVRERMQVDDDQRQGDRGGPSDLDGIPERPELAVVLDEEASYSFFESFLAYKNGFRAHAIASWDEAKRLLGGDGILTPSNASNEERPHLRGEEFHLALEDWYLNFPDQGADRGLSNLRERTERLPRLPLDGSLRRRFVTIGNERSSLDERGRKEDLRQLGVLESAKLGRKVRRSEQVLCKPISGFYSVWEKLGLKRAYPDGAPGYQWPPTRRNQPDSNNGHSSPGRLLQIAEHLLQRCSGLIGEANTVTEAVRGAVLATQALELLAGKTPTCALEALAMKHRFEVLAECQFIGVQHNIEVKQRMEEIEDEVQIIATWFRKRERKASQYDAQVAVYSRLLRIFRDHSQFDEEMECLHWERKAMAKLFAARGGFILGPIVGYTWRYLNWLLRRPRNFLLGISFWLVVGACLMGVDSGYKPAAWTFKNISTAKEPLGWAFDCFVGVEHTAANVVGADGRADAQIWIAWTARILGGLGLFHFGVFISYIYTLVSRK